MQVCRTDAIPDGVLGELGEVGEDGVDGELGEVGVLFAIIRRRPRIFALVNRE
jgi:hypothetical protein